MTRSAPTRRARSGEALQRHRQPVGLVQHGLPDLVEKVAWRLHFHVGAAEFAVMPALDLAAELGGTDRGEDRDDAADLLRGVDRGVARPGRLPADIEQVGTLVDHSARLVDGGGHRIATAYQSVAGERIRRDVEDPHHERPFAPGERRVPDPGRGRWPPDGRHGGGGSRSSGSSTRCARTWPTR